MVMSLPAPGTCVPLTQLSQPDRLLLWAMRAWVIGLQRRIDVLPPLRMAFAEFGIADAAELLDALMSIAACGALRTLSIDCVCSPTASEDESRLLAAAALHQARQGFGARFLLREMLTPAASRDAGEILERLAAVLTAGNCRLSCWPIDAARFVFAPAPEGTPQPTRPTVH